MKAKALEMDVSKYTKEKSEALVRQHSIPISNNTKERIAKIKGRFDINKALREYLQSFLETAETSSKD